MLKRLPTRMLCITVLVGYQIVARKKKKKTNQSRSQEETRAHAERVSPIPFPGVSAMVIIRYA